MNNYIKEIRELLERNHNVILTGAPGTGKTFLAREVAKSMNAEYDFVQFHPSYDYTDFVEGLRPVAGINGSIGFERKDGVFKVFCKKALELNAEIIPVGDNKQSIIYSTDKDKLIEEAMSWLMKQDGATLSSAKRSSIKYILVIGVKSIKLKIPNEKKYPVQLYVVKQYLRGEQEPASNQTYERAVGQFIMNNCPFYKEWKEKNNEEVALNQFQHKDILPIQDTSFVSKNNIVQEKSSRRYVFIIDEINRGEISKIFGELFFSIDPGYRGKKGTVKTQYQNLITDKNDPFYDGFYIPDNVYIIGTMNDIDRSVESMDFAMRRRFAWKEIKANENTGMLDNTLGELKAEAVATMERLNNAIWNEETNEGIDGLSAAYHIGGAYFLKLKLYLDEGLSKEEAYRKLWENHLCGLLFEYLRGSMDADSKLKELEKTYYFG